MRTVLRRALGQAEREGIVVPRFPEFLCVEAVAVDFPFGLGINLAAYKY